MQKAYKDCLVLNASFLPLNLTPLSTVKWYEAVILITSDKATAIHEYDEEIHSQYITMKVPSVVVLKEHVYFKRHAKFSKPNVKIRDNFKCAYCGEEGTIRTLTIDHIHPTSKGGQSEWMNCVTACRTCNHKKSDNLTQRPSHVKPYIPTYMQLAKNYVEHMAINDENWAKYVRYAIGK